jgi:hypothetical protein
VVLPARAGLDRARRLEELHQAVLRRCLVGLGAVVSLLGRIVQEGIRSSEGLSLCWRINMTDPFRARPCQAVRLHNPEVR